MDQKKKTVADYAVIGIAPLLVFFMLSSLANFLMLVLYRGGQPTKVSWTILCFTLGTVAVARLSIERDRTYSVGYLGVLVLVAFLAMARFISSPIASALVLALIAYLADWVIRDCTLIDEKADSSDQGLMESGQFSSLLKRRSGSKKKNGQPGRSVLYLAMGALPLYGIGQMFIRSDQATWQRAKMLLICYLFSAIALLVTTSFLGLRRYLRQRGAEMPRQVSLAWLIAGAGLTALILMIASFAPLPGRALANFELPAFLESPGDTVASKFGWGEDGADQASDGAAQTGQDGRPEGKEIGSETTGEGGEAGQAESGNKKDAPAGKESGGKKSGGDASEQQQDGSESSSNPPQESSSKDSSQSDSQKSDSQKSDSQKSDSQKSDSQKSDSQKSDSQKSGSESDQGQPNPSSKQPQSEPNESSQKNSDPPKDRQSGSNESKSSEGGKNPQESKKGDADKSQDQSDAQSDGEMQDRDQDAESKEEVDDPKADDDSDPAEQPPASEQAENEKEEREPKQSETQQSESKKSQPQKSQPQKAQNPKSKPPPPKPDSSMPGATVVLKAIIFCVLVGMIAMFVWRNWKWLSLWLASLFGRESAQEVAFGEGESLDPSVPPKPFSAYRQPGPQTSADEVIITTFNALVAWSRESGVARMHKETPNEFLIRFLHQFPEMQATSREVVGAYNRIVYGNGNATAAERSAAEQLWQAMRSRQPSQAASPNDLQVASEPVA